jgi:DNA-binding CsgD family transcriptional regulator
MSETRLLSRLIGDIYDAAFDPARWPGVLEEACRFVGSAGLYLQDAVNDAADMSERLEPPRGQNCIDAHVQPDSSSARVATRGVGEVVAISAFIPYDEFLEAPFDRQQWMRPQAWLDLATSLLDESGTGDAVLDFFRPARIDDLARRRVRLLVPHIRRAVFIGKVLLLRDAKTTTLADALDSIAAALFLVDGQGRLTRSNARGQALIADGSILRTAGGRLVVIDPVADQALRDALAVAASGEAIPGKQGTVVPLGRSDGECHVAHVLAAPPNSRRKVAAGGEAIATVLVRKALLATPSTPEIIATLYGLTPGELRVLLAVFESDGMSDLVEVLGISEPTVRTHLRRLFEKTGAKRQANLVKLVAGFSRSVS